jgi:hypothetical protein
MLSQIFGHTESKYNARYLDTCTSDKFLEEVSIKVNTDTLYDVRDSCIQSFKGDHISVQLEIKDKKIRAHYGGAMYLF